MLNVLILQTDNRTDVDFIGLSKLYNSKVTAFMQNNSDFEPTDEDLNPSPTLRGGADLNLHRFKHNENINYRYEFFPLESKHYVNMHPAMGKIGFLDELLNTITDDIIVFLDSDAWINEPTHLQELIERLIAAGPDIHGCFSRDPYVSKNTYVNSGSFVLKVDDFTRDMYKQIIAYTQRDDSHHNLHSYDQYYVSQLIYDNRQHFMVFIPDILNTCYGKILRHNWWKNQKMFKDLYELLDIFNHNKYTIPEPFDFDKEIDSHCWPNPNEQGYEYWG